MSVNEKRLNELIRAVKECPYCPIEIGKFKGRKKGAYEIFIESQESEIYAEDMFIGNFGMTLRELVDEIDFDENAVIVADEERRLDYSKLEKKNFCAKLYVGGTGSGKTYKAIKESVGKRSVIAVPTRQLAYEIAYDYPDFSKFIYTGEIHEGSVENGSGVVVYENLSKEMIDAMDRIIVDEAHFLNDEERGGALLEKVLYAASKEKEIVLLTATDTISEELKKILRIEVEKLKPYKKVEKVAIKDFDELRRKIEEENLTTLVFTKYKPNKYTVEEYCDLLGIDYDDADYINADVPTSERLLKQIAFREGRIKLMVSSNVLAQGVNFPADAVIIEFNEYDDWEIVQQKIGRAGRPQFSEKAYYFTHYVPPKVVKEKKPESYRTEKVFFYRGINISSWNIKEHEIPKGFFDYGDFKYSKRLFEKLEKEGLINEEEKKALEVLRQEERKVKEIFSIIRSDINAEKPDEIDNGERINRPAL